MFFQQIYEPGLAHASYMVGCQKTGECLVIDAKRDVDTYIEIAGREKLRITHIAETHIHADFLSGSRELHALTGAPMILSNEGGAEWQYEFHHEGATDGYTFMVGNIKVQVVHTPGHTPEHISFLVTDTPAAADVPIMMFTGDFVFVGDVGRPDLLEKAAGYKGTMEAGARQLWHSLQRFRALPDHIQVHPAHGAGSACGKALGAIPSSTVGYEKLVNWALRHTNEDEFVAELLTGQPEPPYYFATMKKLNKVPRNLLLSVPEIPLAEPAQIALALERQEFVVDTRSKQAFAAKHIPNTISIPNTKSFSNWAGWILPYDEPFYIIAEGKQTPDIMRKLMRIGLDNVAGYLPDVEAYNVPEGRYGTVGQVSLEEMQAHSLTNDATIVDVRGATEYLGGRIPGSTNIHVGYLGSRIQDLPKTGTIIVSCAGGDRSNIAASILERAGFSNILNFPLGFNGWQKANQPIETQSQTAEKAKHV